MLSENSYIYLEFIFPEVLQGTRFVWLSDYRYELILQKNVRGQFYYTVDFSEMFSFKEKDFFSSPFDVSGEIKIFSKIFINTYGICELEIENLTDLQPTYQAIGSIEVYSDKIQDIQHVLEYLFSKDFYIWNIVSLTKGTASDVEKLSESLFWKLANINTYVQEIECEFIPNVVHDKIYTLTPRHYVDFATPDARISEESLLWLLENAGELEQASIRDENHFLILNRPYISRQILVEKLGYNTNVYENGVLHWFLHDLYSFLATSEHVLREKYLILVEKNLYFKDRVYLAYYKRLLGHIVNLKSRIEDIKVNIDILIPAQAVPPSKIEYQRFRTKQHYYGSFSNLVRWLENRQVVYAPDLLFSGLKDVSKLYEIFCLYKLIDAIKTELKFVEAVDSVPSAQVEVGADETFIGASQVKSTFSFHKNGVQLHLFYDCLPPSLITTAKTGTRDLRPDYVIEIEIDQQSFFLVLDAKYKKITTIEGFDFQNLSLKYLHGIGPLKGGYFNAIALLILNPIVDSKLGFYHRKSFDVFSGNPVFPAISRVEVSTEDPTSTNLGRVLSAILAYLGI
jgi:hypothetical protein